MIKRHFLMEKETFKDGVGLLSSLAYILVLLPLLFDEAWYYGIAVKIVLQFVIPILIILYCLYYYIHLQIRDLIQLRRLWLPVLGMLIVLSNGQNPAIFISIMLAFFVLDTIFERLARKNKKDNDS